MVVFPSALRGSCLCRDSVVRAGVWQCQPLGGMEEGYSTIVMPWGRCWPVWTPSLQRLCYLFCQLAAYIQPVWLYQSGEKSLYEDHTASRQRFWHPCASTCRRIEDILGHFLAPTRHIPSRATSLCTWWCCTWQWSTGYRECVPSFSQQISWSAPILWD